jgi:hypothetical protein
VSVPTTDGAAALAVLEALREAGVDHAVLHGAELLDQPGLLSDVDIVVARSPESVIAAARPALRRQGLFPVVLWPYDIGGSSTVFLVDESARSGVQLDMLHDPRGLGRYRIRSGDLVSERSPGEASPSLVDPDRLVYLWVKRRSKGQDGRLGEVVAALRALDPAAVGEAARRLLTRDDWIAEITGDPRPPGTGRWHGAPQRALLQARRVAGRLTAPIGFWAHLSGDAGEVATSAAARFARVLVEAKAIRAPAGWSAPVWYCREVVPIRLRPGLVVSYGRRPSGIGGPDLELGMGMTVDAVVAQLVRSMHGRLIR